ncbi:MULTISPECIES: DNA mismatch repair protein MutS [Psychrilyobacter]|uniref:DNA mismatch repair protein MutS n=1 Tax=Psychrilyobacter piezotolerans TaxID=2293438 RepID=A0ABX9KGF3_9FUSO|nr:MULTISPECIES: DNA mismatch repair protein MutS [Psychrilyobacter]MCS5421530.1 DNA mismatch repair protein MutS [Psychrilyobacter sp. S5]NDI77757.1 DNA mismatch repair protein MutS [Psychrilyobacter piezotolerans]RDE61454.1 DNA mismatch repair protein MutS [Psychrilyobacter sp. S5]REI40975.1 DNA mismatch repair protein MutS [Psychrilyobacter piezotolerans]
MSKETPLMKQYKEIKEQNQENILFFRLGDFYEMFFEDAVICSKELGITLTSRNKEKGQNVPLAGIPYHSAAGYISKLVAKGYKVAICEQVEAASEAKGLVKREVVKVITPGTVIDTDYLDDKSNNYLLGIIIRENKAGISYLDITTGEFKVTQLEGKDIISQAINEIYKLSPTEILVESRTLERFNEEFSDYKKLNEIVINPINKVKNADEILKKYFNVISLESYGIDRKELAVDAGGFVLEYVLELHKYNELPIQTISYDNRMNYLELNLATQKNLELVENTREKTNMGTLLWVLDRCKTSMGTRMLKKMIKNPLLNIDEIEKRQGDIGYFIDEVLVREDVREGLKSIYDLERLIGKIILGTENARDLIAIKKSIKSSLEVIKILGANQMFTTDIKKLVEIYNLIERSIVEEPPFSVREGGMIKTGHNETLDELHTISKSGKNYILEIEKKEKEKTGLKTLKIKYNKVFGYFLEVSRANSHLVPEEYIRKQTLTNAERYITPELKEYESTILNAKGKIEGLEYDLLKEISGKLVGEIKLLQKLAFGLAYVDVIASLADIATKNNYICPKIVEGYDLEIRSGRHPIVEKLVVGEDYISNDIILDEETKVIVLTGPNMAGKSTYMKQAALIILMAQMGSYVPASSATIGIVDKIFTRVGASDDLVSGQSTFMVEMSEVANIVNNATDRSFVILDEVGRGTSTFDGLSLASAITEYIHDNLGAKTIFATHYHELTELEYKLKYLSNYRIEVSEANDEVVFLREIVKGGADKSYGIEVARLAGLPAEILLKAKQLLQVLETKKAIIEEKIGSEQLSLFGGSPIKIEKPKIVEPQISTGEKKILAEVAKLDVNNLTPLDAMMKLNELKNLLMN